MSSEISEQVKTNTYCYPSVCIKNRNRVLFKCYFKRYNENKNCIPLKKVVTIHIVWCAQLNILIDT